jgi:G:T-mismatch repair DNA endonuclease (very short patch repair protein)
MRDAEVRAALEARGWRVVELWECQLRTDAAARIAVAAAVAGV